MITGQIKFLGAILLSSLFMIALITFAVNFASENNAVYTVDDATTTLKNDAVNNLTVWYGEVGNSSKSFADSEIQTGETFKTGGQFKGGMFEAIGLTSSLMLTGYNKIFGSGSGFGIFFSVFFGFLITVGIMYVYKTWVGRNPD